MTKYIVDFAPPHRFGAVQGVFTALVMLVLIPLSILYSVGIAANGFPGAGRYVVPARSIGSVALVGWALYTARMVLRPMPAVSLLPEDENALMKPFGLETVAQGEEVLGLSRKELLCSLGSSNVLEQRRLLELFRSEQAQARYLALGRKAPIDVE